jgi:hypothetical protein
MTPYVRLALRVSSFLCAFALIPVSSAQDRSFVETANATNLSLLVGVSHGLPGIDKDVDNAEAIGINDHYKFTSTRLMDKEGTAKAVKQNLTDVASKVSDNGTFFFYYSGHGDKGSIYVQDRLVYIEDIRDAVKAGRAGKSPLARMVMIFDSCYSGSLLEPLRKFFDMPEVDERDQAVALADNVTRIMQGDLRDEPYWQKLFVFASSRADETSLAGSDGSVFTVAMKKAFDEVSAAGGTMDNFVTTTQNYTKGHHPVARLVPAEMSNEKLIP